jgi:Nif-specific regulatory protein
MAAPNTDTGATMYLVVRLDDGFGDVFPLQVGQRYTLGRAPTNCIVLKDELCSREHAEVDCVGGRWRVRDFNSRNGSRVNGEPLVGGERELAPGDSVQLGRTNFLFVAGTDQLPDLFPQPEAALSDSGEPQSLPTGIEALCDEFKRCPDCGGPLDETRVVW